MPFRVSLHVSVEAFCRADKVAVGLAPDFEAIIERLLSGADFLFRLNLFTLLFKELQDEIVVFLVLLYHIPHALRHGQPKADILEIPGDEPSEDTLHSRFLLKFMLQVLVLFLFCEVPVELDYTHTIRGEEGLVADGGEIVAGQPERELRKPCRRSLIEISGLDLFAARELLDCFLVQFAWSTSYTLSRCLQSAQPRSGRVAAYRRQSCNTAAL